jgi:hypothetical protein
MFSVNPLILKSKDGNMAANIKKLWLDPNYRASYTGASTFYKALKNDGKIKTNIKYEKVVNLLETIPSYQMHVRRNRNLETRHLNFNPSESETNFIDGVGISFMMDLGFLPESDGKVMIVFGIKNTYFLLFFQVINISCALWTYSTTLFMLNH